MSEGAMQEALVVPEFHAVIKGRLNGCALEITLNAPTGKDLIGRVRLITEALEPLPEPQPPVVNNGACGPSVQPAMPAQGAYTDDNPPLCPTHNKPMKRSSKGSGWYCSTKVGEHPTSGKALYCTETVN